MAAKIRRITYPGTAESRDACCHKNCSGQRQKDGDGHKKLRMGVLIIHATVAGKLSVLSDFLCFLTPCW